MLSANDVHTRQALTEAIEHLRYLLSHYHYDAHDIYNTLEEARSDINTDRLPEATGTLIAGYEQSAYVLNQWHSRVNAAYCALSTLEEGAR